MAKNKVISGDYQGYIVEDGISDVYISPGRFSSEMKHLTKNSIEQYEVLTEDKVKSASSAILRGAAGAALLGPVGLLAGLSARNKSEYTIAILWANGKRSLIEIDQKLYKKFIKGMF